MKRNYIALPGVVLLAMAAASAQSAHNSFDTIKSLAGNWEGKTETGEPIAVSYKVTAGGSAVMSEIEGGMHGKSEDMISMIHMDGDRLMLTHYCSAGNQPRMTASTSPDGKTITFNFLDATNLASPDTPHMDHVVFTFIDANHHVEEWHFSLQGKDMVKKFDLERKS